MPKNKQRTKILIVEDDQFLITMYAAKFEHDNFKVLVAEDGEKGWELIIKEKPDIILLDVLLPKINGFELLKKIKSKKDISNIPVLLLTNLNQKDEIDQGLALGADDYLIKSHFTPSEVVKKTRELLKRN